MTKEVTCTATTGGVANAAVLEVSGHEATGTVGLGGVVTVCCPPFGVVYGGRMGYVAAPVALAVAVLYGLYALFKCSKLKPFA